jgi:UDP-N-acetylmuramyl pentapeptide synthase
MPGNFRGGQITIKGNRGLQFYLNKNVRLTLNTTATHNVYNALAAASCGRLLKVSYENIIRALKKFAFPKGRQLSYKVGKYNIIDDSYNANPVSFRGAVNSLANVKTSGKKIIICGDMLELGGQSKELHQSIGALIARYDINLVISVGKLSKFITQTAKQKNDDLQVYHCATIEKAYKRLKKFLQSGDTILVKGSRSMHMERVIDLLKRRG